MSEKKKNLSDVNLDNIEFFSEKKIGIVVSEWNLNITNSLLEGAINFLKEQGFNEKDILVEWVPGSFELPLGAKYMLKYQDVDSVICLGCVIQGETRHFEFICNAVAQSISDLCLSSNKPIIFGVLTTNDMDQAIARSGGKHGNKGIEAAQTALKMLSLKTKLKS